MVLNPQNKAKLSTYEVGLADIRELKIGMEYAVIFDNEIISKTYKQRDRSYIISLWLGGNLKYIKNERFEQYA